MAGIVLLNGPGELEGARESCHKVSGTPRGRRRPRVSAAAACELTLKKEGNGQAAVGGRKQEDERQKTA